MLFVRRLTATAVIPSRAHPDDAGLDLCADETVEIPEFNRATIHTGIAIALDPTKVGLIWPRSGLAAHGISTDAGVIDSTYRGEIKVVLTNSTPHRYRVEPGQRIAQLLIQQVFLEEPRVVDVLPETERGVDGFGSNGD